LPLFLSHYSIITQYKCFKMGHCVRHYIVIIHRTFEKLLPRILSVDTHASRHLPLAQHHPAPPSPDAATVIVPGIRKSNSVRTISVRTISEISENHDSLVQWVQKILQILEVRTFLQAQRHGQDARVSPSVELVSFLFPFVFPGSLGFPRSHTYSDTHTQTHTNTQTQTHTLSMSDT
jgi:hypothetical protein